MVKCSDAALSISLNNIFCNDTLFYVIDMIIEMVKCSDAALSISVAI
jgi:hypothetical protein